MHYDAVNRTFDCDPTLTDTQVLEFCREGHLFLPGVVSDEINQRTCDYLNGKIPANPCFMKIWKESGIRTSRVPFCWRTGISSMSFSTHSWPACCGRCSANRWGCRYWSAITGLNVRRSRKTGIMMRTMCSGPNWILWKCFTFLRTRRKKWARPMLCPARIFVRPRRNRMRKDSPA